MVEYEAYDYYWFVLRYTKDSSNQNVILKLLQSALSDSQIIVGHEFSRDGVEHTHSVIGVKIKFDTLRTKLKKLFKISSGKDNEGNKVYSLKRVTDLQGAIQYAIKCNKYATTRLFPVKEMLWCKENPWVFPEKKFEDQYNELDEQFLTFKFNDYEYIRAVLQLYARHNKGFMVHFIKQRYHKLANIADRPYYDPYDYGCPRRTFRDMLIYKILQIS